MKLKNFRLLVAIIFLSITTGCANYRTSSNIESEASTELSSSSASIIISEGILPDRKYEEIQAIEVTVKKLTAFNKNPTKEQADEALIEKARLIGADAVINVTYESGVGATTWGYIKAEGLGVKFTE